MAIKFNNYNKWGVEDSNWVLGDQIMALNYKALSIYIYIYKWQ